MDPNRSANAHATHDNISLPVNRPPLQGEWTPGLDARSRVQESSHVQVKPANYVPPEYFPSGKRSLAGIGLRAFFLGNAAIVGFSFAAQLVHHGSHLWRPFLFLGTLSVFHFLEFYTTAAYNTPDAKISSFLLTNGAHYRIAHTVAFVETIITSCLFPSWQSKVHLPMVILAGIILVLVGQVVRSTAMAQAGTNFNHQVQSKKNDGHELVTRGLYAYFRHPSYFGFFWWGIGTQLMVGNTVCTLGYACVLWYFFMKRITHEEGHLIQFFGKDYEKYRANTRTWIPFI
ncbi:protein-S-isoprenylcysteine O-methyltransferase [Didymella exigua CBS 183.55]|uniref:Protein-S-isoprenylcysteine O-methyltransferase n=1 Tax=Didymella exigua CBS 183.55 TaxID=1150837 RepID=A0A6A5RHP1_9PLEO|nr:protein-S-isoprenylcysteine O-methyltransferase [Didymella exigua CBS 183.55]KAF1927302.1 protein-S-isoprenylcysteine O-methyltransferase [Didymella exigua CBS 183.55]